MPDDKTTADRRVRGARLLDDLDDAYDCYFEAKANGEEHDMAVATRRISDITIAILDMVS